MAQHRDFSSTLLHYNLTEGDVQQPVSSLHLQKISRIHCRKWRSLPVYLGMKNHLIWEDIEREVFKEEERKVKFFAEWQSEKGAGASYKSLINALLVLDCKLDAEYVCEILKDASSSRETGDYSGTKGIVKKNIARIKGCFAALIKRISARLNTMDIDLKDFRLYVSTQFSPGKFVSDTDSITEIFSAISRNFLWDYFNFGPVEEICAEFGKEDEELKRWLNSYRADLAGFKATTKIIDYIEACQYEEDVAEPEQSLQQYAARYDKQYCRKLAIKLKDQVTRESLNYIDRFWQSIAQLFLLPSLPVLLESIREGCTEITWMIPTHFSLRLETAMSNKSLLDLFRKFDVMQVTINGKVLFTEKGTNEALENFTKLLEERDSHIKELQDTIQLRDVTISIKDDIIIQLQKELWEQKEQLEVKNKDVEELRAKIQEESTLKRKVEPVAEQNWKALLGLEREKNSKLREEVKKLQNYVDAEVMKELSPASDLQFSWKRGPDMPFEMAVCVKSVVIHGNLYVGGGTRPDWNSANDFVVMEYDTSSGEWASLSPYKARDFAMTVVEDQLILVGGREHDKAANYLGVWRADTRSWTHPYPEMSTARSNCSAVTYREWVLVAGGCTDEFDDDSLLPVEVLSTECKQWYIGPPTPVPWVDMKTAIVGDMCYFMGGYIDGWTTDNVYTLSFESTISHISSDTFNDPNVEIWTEMTSLQLDGSCPLSYKGFLLAVGGQEKDGDAVTAIHLYRPGATWPWVKIGDLPTPRYNCACSMISNREIYVAGGTSNIQDALKIVEFAVVLDL